jgi:hypothetical protein
VKAAARALLIALPAVAVPAVTAAAGHDAGLAACRAIAADAARLACYDRLAGEASGPAAAPLPAPTPIGPVPTAGAPAQPAPVPTPEELFGRDAVAAEAIVRESAGIGQMEELRQPVASVGRNAEGRLVIALANGQAWLQVDGPAPRLAAGEEARIRRAAFGSYLLTTPAVTRGIRVRRIR